MSRFDDQFSSLVSGEMAKARHDPERMGAMIEKMARSLGLVIAVAARGNGKGIDEFCIGVGDYIHGEAVAKAPFARIMADVPASRRSAP